MTGRSGLLNFDGVHRGHQAVLRQAAAGAAARGLPMTVITFEPQPREFFAPCWNCPKA